LGQGELVAVVALVELEAPTFSTGVTWVQSPSAPIVGS
jgi:hypothetical protein